VRFSRRLDYVTVTTSVLLRLLPLPHHIEQTIAHDWLVGAWPSSAETIVDYGLGVEMAILAALACFVVWLGRAPSDTERARPDAA
jgi:hypothetical protein